VKLDAFLATALSTGHSRVKVTSTARGHEVHRGELAGVAADYLEALAIDDAAPLSRAGVHEYIVSVESDDGAKASRHTLRVHGGADAQDDHRVDPLTTRDGAVVGHLVRLIVDQQKGFVQLASKLIDQDVAETRELARLRRAEGRRGGDLLTAKALEIAQIDAAAERERSNQVWTRLLTMGEPIVARVFKGHGGEESALARLRAGLTDAQLEELSTLLGAVRFGRFLALETPTQVAALFIDHVSADEGKIVFRMFSEAQQGLIAAALKAEMDRRNAATAAAAKSAPAADANGAPS
jgi:hypothetical protein